MHCFTGNRVPRGRETRGLVSGTLILKAVSQIEMLRIVDIRDPRHDLDGLLDAKEILKTIAKRYGTGLTNVLLQQVLSAACHVLGGVSLQRLPDCRWKV